MGTSVTATGITFNDASTQTTAAVATAIPTTLYAIGTYAVGRPQNFVNYTLNSTVAGTSIYNTRFNGVYQYCAEGGDQWGAGEGRSLINTGSWRCLGIAYGNGSSGWAGIWIRYA